MSKHSYFPRIGLDKAERAGKVLADTLISQVQEHRPVTLMGFSLGARVIYFCLIELYERGGFGLVDMVYIFGCPVIGKAKTWTKAASVVSGRIVNGYLSKDWVLGVLFRASSASWGAVAGMSPVEVEGFENVNLDDVIGIMQPILTFSRWTSGISAGNAENPAALWFQDHTRIL